MSSIVSGSEAPAGGVEVPTDPSPAVEQRVGVVRYDEYFNTRTFSQALRKTRLDRDRTRKTTRKNPVLVVRRVIDPRGQLSHIAIDIMSPELREVLRSLHANTEAIFALPDAALTVDHKFLFHSLNGLTGRLEEERRRDVSGDSKLIFDLETIINFMKEDYGSTISEIYRLTSIGRITFNLLWALFEPGCVAYRRHPLLDVHQVVWFHQGVYSRDARGVPSFTIHFKLISNDGNATGFLTESVNIQDFPETMAVSDLPMYPFRLHPDRDEIYQYVVERGRRFAAMDNRQLFETDGFAIEEARGEVDKDFRRLSAYGRVMIDPTTFSVFQPNNPLHRDIHWAIPGDVHSLPEGHYAIFTPIVLGFCFGTKSWAGFALENLRAVDWDADAFDKLVMDEGRKSIIHALIRRHSSHKKSFDDIIRGKGQGLVGLLCGGPGCGKTLTAEAVAEVTRKPLYLVGTGELGTTASEVDWKLSQIFDLSHRWDAVVLLDEADVFLHKRGPHAIEQNALVAVFLRHLEYYQGILMMTTNMSENIDPAFESRIHFCMYYPNLDCHSRKPIWKTFLRRSLGDSDGFTEHEYDSIAKKYALNGRQIKNVVSLAVSLAAEQNAPMSLQHLDLVLQTKAHWDDNKAKMCASPSRFGIPGLLVGSGIVALISVIILMAGFGPHFDAKWQPLYSLAT